MAENTIFVKKVTKVHGGHHGGAWKVAYADFVTAMMAFFLLLWLLNAVTEEQLQGIADYFVPTDVSKSTSGSGQPLDGPSPNQSIAKMPLPPATLSPDGASVVEFDESEEDITEVSEEELEEIEREREQQQFEKAKRMLESAVDSIPELEGMKESLLVENTPEGLRIQLVDRDGFSMFPTGSANPFGPARAMLALVSRVVNQMPQKVAISGHTDAAKFRGGEYTNWELSADRANTARRVLRAQGVPEERFAQVVGKAANDPLLPAEPLSARNRRISIVLLRSHPAADAVAPEPVATPEPAPVAPAAAPVAPAARP